MVRLSLGLAMLLLVLTARSGTTADARAPLQPFHDLIGVWKGTGLPETGTKTEKSRGAWTEKLTWEWGFKDADAWLAVSIDKGKYFLDGKLRALPEKDKFRLTLQTVDKETLVFEGTLADKLLTLDREDEKKGETHRLVFSLLHSNRHLYRYEVRAKGQTRFNKVYQVGATKEGVPFAVASGQSGPECIVSGGPGTMAVMYKGKTYYVCCSGCRSAFLDEPEKYIKEFEDAKLKAKEKGK